MCRSGFVISQNKTWVSCPGEGVFSHWHGIHICACLLGHFFAKIGIAIGGVSSERKEPKLHKLGVFWKIFVKSTQFGQNWVLFFRKWYTDGWEIGQKIGIEKVRFSRSGRHIHVWFWWEYPPPRFTDAWTWYGWTVCKTWTWILSKLVHLVKCTHLSENIKRISKNCNHISCSLKIPGGGVLIFWRCVRPEVRNPYVPMSKDFSQSKNGWLDRVFFSKFWLILPFFRSFCTIGSSSKDFFWPKWTHV